MANPNAETGIAEPVLSREELDSIMRMPEDVGNNSRNSGLRDLPSNGPPHSSDDQRTRTPDASFTSSSEAEDFLSVSQLVASSLGTKPRTRASAAEEPRYQAKYKEASDTTGGDPTLRPGDPTFRSKDPTLRKEAQQFVKNSLRARKGQVTNFSKRVAIALSELPEPDESELKTLRHEFYALRQNLLDCWNEYLFRLSGKDPTKQLEERQQRDLVLEDLIELFGAINTRLCYNENPGETSLQIKQRVKAIISPFYDPTAVEPEPLEHSDDENDREVAEHFVDSPVDQPTIQQLLAEWTWAKDDSKRLYERGKAYLQGKEHTTQATVDLRNENDRMLQDLRDLSRRLSDRDGQNHQPELQEIEGYLLALNAKLVKRLSQAAWPNTSTPVQDPFDQPSIPLIDFREPSQGAEAAVTTSNLNQPPAPREAAGRPRLPPVIPEDRIDRTSGSNITSESIMNEGLEQMQNEETHRWRLTNEDKAHYDTASVRREFRRNYGYKMLNFVLTQMEKLHQGLAMGGWQELDSASPEILLDRTDVEDARLQADIRRLIRMNLSSSEITGEICQNLEKLVTGTEQLIRRLQEQRQVPARVVITADVHTKSAEPPKPPEAPRPPEPSRPPDIPPPNPPPENRPREPNSANNQQRAPNPQNNSRPPSSPPRNGQSNRGRRSPLNQDYRNNQNYQRNVRNENWRNRENHEHREHRDRPQENGDRHEPRNQRSQRGPRESGFNRSFDENRGQDTNNIPYPRRHYFRNVCYDIDEQPEYFVDDMNRGLDVPIGFIGPKSSKKIPLGGYKTMDALLVPIFNGKVSEYRRFRQAVINHIDRKKVFAVTKADALISRLQGIAYSTVKYIHQQGTTEKSWYKLIFLLDKTFGKIQDVRLEVIAEVSDYPTLTQWKVATILDYLSLLRKIQDYCKEFDPEGLRTENSEFFRLVFQICVNYHRLYNEYLGIRRLDMNIVSLIQWVEYQYDLMMIEDRYAQDCARGRGREVRKIENRRFAVHAIAEEDEAGPDLTHRRDSCQYDETGCHQDHAGTSRFEADQSVIPNPTMPVNQSFYRKNLNSTTINRSIVASTPAPSEYDDDAEDAFFNDGPRVNYRTFLGFKGCYYCKGSHYLAACPEFAKQSCKIKNDFTHQNGICYHCLRAGHRVKMCKINSGQKCGQDGCTAYHHALLHNPDAKGVKVEDYYSLLEQYSPLPETTNAGTHQFVESEDVMFTQNREYIGIRQAIIDVVGDTSTRIVAALDSCSNNTNIDADVARDLKLKILEKGFKRRINTIRGIVDVTSDLVELVIQPIEGGKMFKIKAYTVPSLMGNTQVVNWADSVKRFPHFKPITNYPELPADSRYSLLLGTDFHELMLASHTLRGRRGEPAAEYTDLGWAFSGPSSTTVAPAYFHVTQMNIQAEDPDNVIYQTSAVDSTNQLFRIVDRHFHLEDLHIQEPLPNLSNEIQATQRLWTPEEKQADEKMIVATSTEVPGAYCMTIPFKQDPPPFSTNRFAVLNQQTRYEAKKGADFSRIYAIFDGYLNKDYIRKLTYQERFDYSCFYLPWHCVFKDEKEKTTPIRPVFNAAAVDQFGRSLNSEIFPTPNRLNNLFDVLLRFRQWEFCVSADVSEMFLRVRLDPTQRKYQRFLYQGEDYEWNTMLFGNQCAPNGSQKVLAQVCKDHGDRYPEARETVEKSAYMDDAIDSRPTESQMVKLVEELPQLFRCCNMILRKFYTNSIEALKKIPDDLRSTLISFKDEEPIYENNKVLGVAYMGKTDEFHFDSKVFSISQWENDRLEGQEWTKRWMLRAGCSVYDVLGFVAPITIQARALLQQVWKRKIGWDDPLPIDLMEKWKDWLNDLPNVEKVRVPRWVYITPEDVKRELHVFVDSSSTAMCCAAYVRITRDSGEVFTNLICAKARVASVKSETISRQELIACVLGTRLARAILKTLDIPIENWVMWTDSQVCLYWISNSAKAYKAFVANRVNEIQRATKVEQWRHVPTAENPADVGTRPLSVQELIESTKWWNGPAFLKLPEDQWPKTKLIEVRTTEEKTYKTTNAKGDANPDDLLPTEESSNFGVFLLQQRENWDHLERIQPENWTIRLTMPYQDERNVIRLGQYDGYSRCLRRWYFVYAIFKLWKMRALYKSPVTCNDIGEPSPKDYRDVHLALMRKSQHEFYGKAFDKQGRYSQELLKKHYPELMKLTPYFDENDQLLHARSRLKHIRHLSIGSRFPIILHRRSGYALFQCRKKHLDLEHPVGHNQLVNEMQRAYAIIGLGTLCHQVKYECYLCKVQRTRAIQQRMADLPYFRFGEKFYPFKNTGLDFCGPFKIRVATKLRNISYNCWVLVFTCMQVRAVHFEVVTIPDTESFILALQRFADIRGAPEMILSDNQRTFVGANRILQEWLHSVDLPKVIRRTSTEWKGHPGVNWQFTPPLSPHQGGVFETVVKAFKRALRATYDQFLEKMEIEEFRSAVSHIGNLLNSRPVCPLGDHEDPLALTPNDILRGARTGELLPSRDPKIGTDLNLLRRRYLITERFIQDFWKKFQTRMAGQLGPREKWADTHENLKIGDIVAEISPNAPRDRWQLRRVVAIYPDADKLVRRVMIRDGSNRTYERAVQRLVPVVP